MLKDGPSSPSPPFFGPLTSLKCVQMLAPLSQVTCLGAALEIKIFSNLHKCAPYSSLQADSSAVTHQRIPQACRATGTNPRHWMLRPLGVGPVHPLPSASTKLLLGAELVSVGL